MKKYYKNWPVHNLVGHPLMQLFYFIGMNDLAGAVHDCTLPENHKRKDDIFDDAKERLKVLESQMSQITKDFTYYPGKR